MITRQITNNTFYPNWFNKEHFEAFIGRKFINDEEYEEFLETFQEEYGNTIANALSAFVKDLVQQFDSEQQ